MPATEQRQKDTTASTAGKSRSDNGRPHYVRLDLTPEQKDQMSVWAEETADRELLELYVSAQMDGYVYSAKALDQGYQASLTPSMGGAEKNNGGKCLVTRASTPERAMYSLFFKHCVLLKTNWNALMTAAELEW